MSKRIFTKEEIVGLQNNPNVHRCSERSISYDKDFKIKAVEQYKEGLTGKKIFNLAGFDLNVIGRDSPKSCLKCWNKIYRQKGVAGLEIYSRGMNGGRQKTLEIIEKDKIKRLEAEVAYLKAENDFLAKLRAKRAERNSGRTKNTGLYEI